MILQWYFDPICTAYCIYIYYIILFKGVIETVHEFAGGNEDEKDSAATGSRKDDRGIVGTCEDKK